MSVQGIISANQQTNLIGDKLGDALPEARHAPPWQGRGNAVQTAFSRLYGLARAWTLSQGRPLGPLTPGAYKYPPRGLQLGDIQSFSKLL